MDSTGIYTPPGFNDEYTDNSRPHKTKATLVVHGQPTQYWYHAGHRLWYVTVPSTSTPQIHVQPSSPVASPYQQYTMPNVNWPGNVPGFGTGTTYQTQTAPPAPPKFPGRLPIISAPTGFSARMHLDYDIPVVQILSNGLASVSSGTNQHYANVSGLLAWDLPQGLSGYENLPAELLYSAAQIDPAIQISGEADAIWASRLYIVTPVNSVLCRNTSYPIRCGSEDSHSVKVMVDGNIVEHMSRVDLSWSVKIQEIWYRFAVLEFKRPGAIVYTDWSPALVKKPVVRSAKKICQQLSKYAYTFHNPFNGVCDWFQLVLLRFGGSREQWKDTIEIESNYRWVEDRNEMKRNLYVFLKEALDDFLRRNQIQGQY
jgi:hypothetical protein